MATVTLRLARQREQVDLDQLTLRARALAELWAATPLQTTCPVTLESVRTLREMGADPDEAALWWGKDALDRPHRIVWDSWARYRGGDLAEHLERLVLRLPVGYVPVGTVHASVEDQDEVRADADLITRAQVLDVLAELGRPISPAVLDNYKSRPPKGWPQPVRYVGRTPQWSRAAIEAYAQRADTPTR